MFFISTSVRGLNGPLYHYKNNKTSLSLVFFINGFLFCSWLPHIPYFLLSHNLSMKQSSIMLFSLAFGAFIAMLVSPFILSKERHCDLQRRKVWACKKHLSAVSLCVIALSISVLDVHTRTLSLYINLFIFGWFIGLLDVLMNAMALELDEGRSNLNAKPNMRDESQGQTTMPMLHGFYSFGGLIGAGGASLLLAYNFTVSIHLMMVAVGAFVLSLVFIALYKNNTHFDSRDIKSRVTNSDDGALTQFKMALYLIAACAALSMSFEGALIDWQGVFLNIYHGLDHSLSAHLFTLFSIIITFMRFSAGRFIARFGQVKLLIIGALFSVLGLLLFIYASQIVLSSLGLIMCAMGAANITPILFDMAGKLPTISANTASATVSTIAYSGLLFTPVAVGILADVSDLRFAFLMVAFFPVILCFIVFIVIPRTSKGGTIN